VGKISQNILPRNLVNYEICGVVPKQTKIGPKRTKAVKKKYIEIPILSTIFSGGAETVKRSAESEKFVPKPPKSKVPKRCRNGWQPVFFIRPVSFLSIHNKKDLLKIFFSLQHAAKVVLKYMCAYNNTKIYIQWYCSICKNVQYLFYKNHCRTKVVYSR
jgi:hypothetical protein